MAIPGINKHFRTQSVAQFDPEIVINSICEYFSVSLEQLTDASRTRKNVYRRQLAMYFLYKYSDLTYKQIASRLNRDHTTVVYSKDLIKDLIDVDDNIKTEVAIIKDMIIGAHR
jgi:chromosomal replication initiator protein